MYEKQIIGRILWGVIAVISGIFGSIAFHLFPIVQQQVRLHGSDSGFHCPGIRHNLGVSKDRIERLKKRMKTRCRRLSYFPITSSLSSPLRVKSKIVVDYLEEKTYNGVYWGKHLGVDLHAPPGTPVYAAGDGIVVYSRVHSYGWDGKQRNRVPKRNWGGLVIIKHFPPLSSSTTHDDNSFYTIYGGVHYDGKRHTHHSWQSRHVRQGQLIGKIAKAQSHEGGWEDIAHLHFAVWLYKDYHSFVPPGYFIRDNQPLTDLHSWRHPLTYIRIYNRTYKDISARRCASRK